MKQVKYTETLHELWSRISFVALAVVSVFSAGLLFSDSAAALYILTGTNGTDSAVVLETDQQMQKVSSYASQLYYAGSRASGFDLNIRAGQSVIIRRDGVMLETVSQGESISSLLERMDAAPGPLEMVLVDVSGQAIDLTVASDLTYYDRCSEAVAYTTERISTPELPKGTEQVVQAGSNGIRTAVYEVTYSGGQLVSRQLVDVEDSTMVPEKILVGTAVEAAPASEDRLVSVSKNADGSGVLTFQSGSTLRFTEVKSMTATAYTAGYGGADYCTATGTAVHVGTVAVDKRVIPLGTRMYIVTEKGDVVYGMAVAEDTGVKGNKIDLYYNTYQECINFGRRTCSVYILE
ncbi:G5 and 3D domain-containing protein [Dysosmobacter sp.]|uniref:G5 and 3D domain-containing protein n=1 Tax=Dysosmobacter sp. TaxID=2591382 RepID=UPI002A86BDD3|nr:G5 domain-containing protein [Dysosmobacter sp.]MDY3281844.1 G5 domain-containing protein [Dysosmobacter sp.]